MRMRSLENAILSAFNIPHTPARSPANTSADALCVCVCVCVCVCILGNTRTEESFSVGDYLRAGRVSGRRPFLLRSLLLHPTIALISIDGSGVRWAEKKQIFQAEWLSVPGLGRVEEEAVLRSRCGVNFFNSLPKVERFDPGAAGA